MTLRNIALASLLALAPAVSALAQSSIPQPSTGHQAHDHTPRVHDRAPRPHSAGATSRG